MSSDTFPATLRSDNAEVRGVCTLRVTGKEILLSFTDNQEIQFSLDISQMSAPMLATILRGTGETAPRKQTVPPAAKAGKVLPTVRVPLTLTSKTRLCSRCSGIDEHIRKGCKGEFLSSPYNEGNTGAFKVLKGGRHDPEARKK